MEKTFKIFGFITKDDEENRKIVTDVRVFLTLTNGDNSISGELMVPVPYDDNIVFTNMEDLTEEQVTSWLDIDLINQELDNLETVRTFKHNVEAHSAPWIKNDTPKLAEIARTSPFDITVEEPVISRPQVFDLEGHIANVVLRILAEKGISA